MRHVLHDGIQNELSTIANRASISHKGGIYGKRRTCEGIFDDVIHIPTNDEASQERQRGIIPDLAIYGEGVSEPDEGAPRGVQIAGENTLVDVKTIGVTERYCTAARSRDPHSGVDKRQNLVTPQYLTHATCLDQAHNGTPQGTRGPIEERLREFNGGKVSAPTVGPFSECSADLHCILDTIAHRLAEQRCQLINKNFNEVKSVQLMRLRRRIILRADTSWSSIVFRGLNLTVRASARSDHARRNMEDTSEGLNHDEYHHSRGQ